jgi:hypothetical protein
MLTRFFFWGVGEVDSAVMVVEGRERSGYFKEGPDISKCYERVTLADDNSDDDNPLGPGGACERRKRW